MIDVCRMHIGILNDPNNFHTRKWARALRLEGAKVTVFSFNHSRDEEDEVQLDPFFADKGNPRYWSYLRGGRQLTAALDRAGVDVLNAINVTPFGVWARKSGFRPVIMSAIGSDIFEYVPDDAGKPNVSWNENRRNDGFWGRLRRNYHRKQVRRSLAAADLVTGDNQALLDAMRRHFGVPDDKLNLLRWGVEPELFEVNDAQRGLMRAQVDIREGKRIILSPRGLKTVYNAAIIFEAFQKLLQSRGDGSFHCVMLTAGYDTDPELLKRARTFGKKNPNFSLVESGISREYMPHLWDMTDIFVNVPAFDGYSAALAEGRYAGAIPIVNDIPAHRELLRDGENALYVKELNAENLCVRLEYALDHVEQLKAKMGERNRAWIEENSLMQRSAKEFIKWCGRLRNYDPTAGPHVADVDGPVRGT